MGATKLLATRVTADVKASVSDIVRKELLTESIWLRRLVVRELRTTLSDGGTRHRGNGPVFDARKRRSELRAPGSSLYVRLAPEDRLLLRERATARSMASATYVSVLVRAHLRGLTPLPKDELLALKKVVGELGAVGRVLNQIAKASNQGQWVAGPGREEFMAILKICEALRDHTKALIKGNAASWSTGHAEPAD